MYYFARSTSKLNLYHNLIRNIMKKICLLVLVCKLSNFYAQGYDVISDDVEKIKKFTLHLNPWYGEYYGVNSTSGWGWKTEFFFKKSMSLDFTFRKAKYMDKAKEEMSLTPSFKGIDGFKDYTSIEPILTFHVKKKVREENLRVRLSYVESSKDIGNTRYTTSTEKYINVPGEVLTVSGIRVGVSNVSTTYNFNSSNMANFDINYDNPDYYGTHVPGAVAPEPYITETLSYGLLVDSVPILESYTKFSSTAFVLGFSRKRITNVRVKVKDFGQKGNNFTTTLYGDFFVGAVSFDTGITQENMRLDISSKLKENGGWRLGFQYKKTNAYGISYSAEMGTRPGFKGPKLSRFYMQATVGFSLVTPWKRN